MARAVKNYIVGGEKTRKERFFGASVYIKIFTVAAIIFFLLGISTLGSFNGTGKSVTVPRSSQTVSMAYRLTYEEGQSLSAVYINVGTVYADAGADRNTRTAQIRAYYFDGSDWNNSLGTTANFANIYADNASAAYKTNVNYNWVALVTDRSILREYIRISFTANHAGVQINEVAFADKNGTCIKASVAPEYCDRIEPALVAHTLDKQNSFRISDGYQYNFTQNEAYILESINGIEIGGAINADNVYVMSTDYNSLGILIYAFSFWIFGKSAFGLRLPSFLSGFGLFVLLFFFGRRLFKDDKWGLVLSCLFAFGGMFFTFGRTGTPAALALFAVAAGIYFIYRFYSEGIDGAHPVKTALPVLFSGICMAAAFCINSLTVFSGIITVILFLCGLLRMYKHRAYRIAKAERVLKTQSGAKNEGAVSATGAAICRIKADYTRKMRLAVGFFAVSLLFAPLLAVIAGAPTYGAFVRYYHSENYIFLLCKGIAQCFSVGDITSYTATNAFSPLGWFVALKGATVYDRSVTGVAETVLQLNIQANAIMAYAAAFSFLFCTGYVLFSVWNKRNKRFKTIFRVYFGLLFGMLAGLAPYFFAENVSAAESYTFNLFYASFIALAFFILESFGKDKPENKLAGVSRMSASGVVLIVLFGLFAGMFVLTAPMCFGWQVGIDAAKVMFNWAAIVSNGHYGLIAFG